jgi:hypothetical protein
MKLTNNEIFCHVETNCWQNIGGNGIQVSYLKHISAVKADKLKALRCFVKLSVRKVVFGRDLVIRALLGRAEPELGEEEFFLGKICYQTDNWETIGCANPHTKNSRLPP